MSLARIAGIVRLPVSTVHRVITDKGACDRSRLFNEALGATKHTDTLPYRPVTNGQVEPNRTLFTPTPHRH